MILRSLSNLRRISSVDISTIVIGFKYLFKTVKIVNMERGNLFNHERLRDYLEGSFKIPMRFFIGCKC